MTNEEILKPCPFCGGTVNIYYSSATNAYYVIHENSKSSCIMITPMMIRGKFKSLKEAYSAWNGEKE